ncbi:hypothetical protein FNF27_00362 [Cafeteria roenbergensis]|uniref:Uncharacterized protein n=2 Tax=Cafeteria roenbergensis TaxID=33653 RepID=A0A5A8EMA0_CAFRO|nr:hypothetical protein FNF27_00362 [Cafeteria roenbergensis]
MGNGPSGMPSTAIGAMSALVSFDRDGLIDFHGSLCRAASHGGAKDAVSRQVVVASAVAARWTPADSSLAEQLAVALASPSGFGPPEQLCAALALMVPGDTERRLSLAFEAAAAFQTPHGSPVPVSRLKEALAWLATALAAFADAVPHEEAMLAAHKCLDDAAARSGGSSLQCDAAATAVCALPSMAELLAAATARTEARVPSGFAPGAAAGPGPQPASGSAVEWTR